VCIDIAERGAVNSATASFKTADFDRNSLNSKDAAWRAVSPSSRLSPSSANSFDQEPYRLSNPLAAAQRGDALLATQTSQDNPDLFTG
jgi:hypothetical protein